jgi:hypothetical protein
MLKASEADKMTGWLFFSVLFVKKDPRSNDFSNSDREIRFDGCFGSW